MKAEPTAFLAGAAWAMGDFLAMLTAAPLDVDDATLWREVIKRSAAEIARRYPDQPAPPAELEPATVRAFINGAFWGYDFGADVELVGDDRVSFAAAAVTAAHDQGDALTVVVWPAQLEKESGARTVAL